MKYNKITLFILLFIMSTNISCQNNNSATAKEKSIFDIEINSLNGVKLNLGDFKGKKILFVNVASKCGFTGQYEGLQKLYEEHKDKLTIIGLPCNQFGGQEPGTRSEIASFCKLNYGVSFPMTEKINVKGKNQHELYKWLTKKELNGLKSSTVRWNFQKYLVDEEGNLIDFFYSMTKPNSKKILQHLGN